MLENIYSIVMAVVSVLTILFSIISLFRASSNKHSIEEQFNETSEKLAESEKNVESLSKINKLIKEIIPQCVVESEKMGLLNGNVKKLYCLSQVLLKCNDIGLDYDENATLIDEEIEKNIDFSKLVNYKKGEKDDSVNN